MLHINIMEKIGGKEKYWMVLSKAGRKEVRRV